MRNGRFLALPAAMLLFSGAGAWGGGYCHQTSWGFVPLPELGTGTFNGVVGGLYGNGEVELPPAHLAAGSEAAALIEPLDASGQPDPDGKIGVVGLGMSNANLVFASLQELLAGGMASNVVFVNGSFGGVHAGLWANADHTVWSNSLPAKLAEAGLTTQQVQVVLHYHGMAHSVYPVQPWPDTPEDFQAFCEQIATNTKAYFPATRLMFWSPREYGGYAITVNNPEPYAYYSAFAIKWMIDRQIAGEPVLNWEPSIGPVHTAWMAWGPYTWADGLRARDDGLFYECRDFQADGTHPRMRGRAKIAAQWLRFLHTHPLTSGWLNPPGNLPPRVMIIGPPENTALPVGDAVVLEALAQDEDGAITHVDFFHESTWLGSSHEPPHYWVWASPPTGAVPVSAVAWDDSGAGRTSRTVTLILHAAGPTSNGAAIASDSFESGDFVGGAGWASPGWTVQGVAEVTTNSAPPEGFWQARLRGASALRRDVQLTGLNQAMLSFSWRGQLPAGHAFRVEFFTPASNLVFLATNTQTTVTNVAVELPMPASTSQLRFRLTAPGTNGIVLLDEVLIQTEGGAPDPLVVDMPESDQAPWLMRWPTRAGESYQVLTGPEPDAVSTRYATTAEETSDAVWIEYQRVPVRVGGVGHSW
ncbi:MAG TPA: hypothetical protein PKA51_04540 [Kiritimatiellia bacterium]|nr:hypothetical protein [Kiritimatiellia bacterium]